MKTPTRRPTSRPTSRTTPKPQTPVVMYSQRRSNKNYNISIAVGALIAAAGTMAFLYKKKSDKDKKVAALKQRVIEQEELVQTTCNNIVNSMLEHNMENNMGSATKAVVNANVKQAIQQLELKKESDTLTKLKKEAAEAEEAVL